MTHTDKIKITPAWLAKTFMVAALALSALASHAQDGISKSAVTLGQSAALTGPSATLGVPNCARHSVACRSLTWTALGSTLTGQGRLQAGGVEPD